MLIATISAIVASGIIIAAALIAEVERLDRAAGHRWHADDAGWMDGRMVDAQEATDETP